MVDIRDRRLFNSVNTLCKYVCTKSTDGMEGDEIHCLKEGGIIDGARETVKRDATALTFLPLAASPEVDDVDPFVDIEEYEEELEKKEVSLTV